VLYYAHMNKQSLQSDDLKQSLQDKSLKSFYASGFLYSFKTHQILLLSSFSSYSMIGGEGHEGEEAQETFQRIINKLLKLKLKGKNIYPVYDYFDEALGKINYVFYAEVDKAPINLAKKSNMLWVTFAETLKLLFSDHTKQDLIVGERVINLKQRIDLNIQ